ncbi:hypothetical protein K5549_002719 [Capra hircus]|nr:hypothetical protein K5549_002719 [Capra hircus]
MKNYTAITTFILVGLTDDPNLKILLFNFLFLTYLLSVVGNLIIITLTLVDPHLKTPMYFFLRNFSILEVSFTTVCIPRFLYTMASGDNTVTYNACATQLFFVVILGVSFFFLLTAMSYDHHFGCDAAPILKITCSDTEFLERFVLVLAILTLLFTLVCVIMSYTYIIRTILRFPSAQQRKKAFSTCSSHIIVVSITYGTCIFIYIKPHAKEGLAINKVVSVLTTSVAPVLNPFIYTLRNKQVVQAFKDMIKRVASYFKELK